jgi:Leu/Phe-tRNA-protein transferase
MNTQESMTNAEEIRAYLEENNPYAMMIEPKAVDVALIGTARVMRDDNWTYVAMYSYDKLVDYFTKEFIADCASEDEAVDMAVEWIDFNIIEAYHGVGTPLILYT